MANNRLSIEEKLLAKASWQGECLIWSGDRYPNGYGRIRLDGKLQRAHRVMYELHNSSIPAGSVIRHACDNPSCIAPEHLILGTQAENVADMWSRNRASKRHGAHSNSAKLTDSQVEEIRSRYKSHDRLNGGPALAREYGVNQKTILSIIHNTSWQQEGYIQRPRSAQISHNGKSQSVTAWAREIGISANSLFMRLRLGWSVERALTTPKGGTL